MGEPRSDLLGLALEKVGHKRRSTEEPETFRGTQHPWTGLGMWKRPRGHGNVTYASPSEMGFGQTENSFIRE